MAHTASLDHVNDPSAAEVTSPVKKAAAPSDRPSELAYLDQPSNVHGFWLQALFVLKYWLDDNSNQFEMTDAAIEKAVNLSFQLIKSNTLDSLLDFGKFIFTRK